MLLNVDVGCGAFVAVGHHYNPTNKTTVTVLGGFEIVNDLNYDANYFVDNYEGCCYD